MDAACRALPEVEKKRYETHQNRIEDEGYRNFLKPIWRELADPAQPSLRILDYGCGPNPVLAQILEGHGHHVQVYDPFFAPQQPQGKFDLIVCTEAIEHFYKPRKEIENMEALLDQKSSVGKIWVMTQIFEKPKFSRWWYVRDFTHVCFFSEKALGRLSTRIVLKR